MTARNAELPTSFSGPLATCHCGVRCSGYDQKTAEKFLASHKRANHNVEREAVMAMAEATARRSQAIKEKALAERKAEKDAKKAERERAKAARPTRRRR